MIELHPRFVARDAAMRADAAERGWHITHIRTTATYQEQLMLYRKFLNGTGNQAANPDATGYESPWGWTQHGSWHMGQVDDWCHAIDYAYSCTTAEFHALCAGHGIGFPVVGEAWHAQWFNWDGIFINHRGDDMNKQEFADAIGAHIDPRNGLVSVELVNDTLDGTTLYPLADAIRWTHEEMKRNRLT